MRGSFGALQTLARSFGAPVRREAKLVAIAVELGPVALPLCLRELRNDDEARRTWAAELLLALAENERLRARIVAALREHASGVADDETKVCALGLLAELGEATTSASFRDPGAIHRRSLTELAELLTCRPDVALAADLLVSQLDGDALLELVDALAQTAPARTRHLVDELLLRTDLDAGVRGDLVRIAAPLALVASEPLADPPRRAPRVIHLQHESGRRVIIVVRREDLAGPTAPGREPDRWRCLCLLVDADGFLADGLYKEDAAPRAIREELVEPLIAEGYGIARSPDGSRAAPTRFAAARALIAAAARRTVAARRELPPSYFLGRDLLALADAHEPDWRARCEPDLPTTLLGRAVDLLAAGEFERARPLLERCVELVPDDPEAAASFGLCLLGNGDLEGARGQLERAAALEPGWPLHHWNLAAIAHRQGRLDGCYLALRAYRRTAELDPDRAQRLALAEQFISEHQRMVKIEARLRGRARSRPTRSATDTARSRTRRSAARRPRR